MPFTTFVAPEVKQFVGTAREAVSGTALQPTVSIPADKYDPAETPTFLDDKSLRGDMATQHGMILGVELSTLGISGNVYMDTIGYLLHNILGDYTATGTVGGTTWTATTGVALGATSITVTTGTVATAGTAVQVGTGANAEVCVVGTGSTATNIVLSSATPTRFAHTGSTTITLVSAPFTHVFSLLNSGTGQPVTHTMTHYQGLSATSGARQYSYWCASQLEFELNSEQLFTYQSNGTSILSNIDASSPVNVASTITALPVWRTLVGIGGPASGGTLVSDTMETGVTITRGLKPYFTLQGSQNPYIIARTGLEISGKLTELAQSEQPLLNMLQNTQPQLQIVITNGASGASLLSCTFDIQQAGYDTVKMNAADEIQYDVSFKAIANSTNAGQSGGLSPGKVTLVNAVPSY